jgi:hypothetical protein
VSAPTWEQIIDAVIAGDARIGPYIARQIRIAKFGPPMPLESIGVKIPANIAPNRAGVESDIEAAIIETPPLPLVEIDPSPLTDDEIAYGQRIANDPAVWETGTVYRAPDIQESQIAPVPPQVEPNISVAADRVGGAGSKSAAKSNASVKSSNRGAKRNPKAVQQVIDYLMRNPNDIGLKVAELTDKLKYDVRMKVGHSSVGKALGVMKANGQEKVS